MKLKKMIPVLLTICMLIMAGTAYYFLPADRQKLDMTVVNDIMNMLAEDWDNARNGELPGTEYGLDYTITDRDGKFIQATRDGLRENLTEAAAHRDTIVDIQRGGETPGKLVIHNTAAEEWQGYRDRLLFTGGSLTVLTGLCFMILFLYLERKILQPFEKLKVFAGHVAAGDLEAPLTMDKDNLFGAFTESFDLMREELAGARENERKANQSKKELVASLSHDIKTPVASIQAVAEVMMVKTTDEEAKRQLDVIGAKAEQINTLVTNMFQATLEELQQLKVKASEHPSTLAGELIRQSDYNNRIRAVEIPECMIWIDAVRLEQVIDNIIGNSYKYAGTAIEIAAQIRDDHLEIEFQDHGAGVSEKELPLVFQKFYRGEQAGKLPGSGLGLYISRYLMEEMGGEIRAENTEHGFCVSLIIPLA